MTYSHLSQTSAKRASLVPILHADDYLCNDVRTPSKRRRTSYRTAYYPFNRNPRGKISAPLLYFSVLSEIRLAWPKIYWPDDERFPAERGSERRRRPGATLGRGEPSPRPTRHRHRPTRHRSTRPAPSAIVPPAIVTPSSHRRHLVGVVSVANKSPNVKL